MRPPVRPRLAAGTHSTTLGLTIPETLLARRGTIGPAARPGGAPIPPTVRRVLQAAISTGALGSTSAAERLLPFGGRGRASAGRWPLGRKPATDNSALPDAAKSLNLHSRRKRPFSATFPARVVRRQQPDAGNTATMGQDPPGSTLVVATAASFLGIASRAYWAGAAEMKLTCWPARRCACRPHLATYLAALHPGRPVAAAHRPCGRNSPVRNLNSGAPVSLLTQRSIFQNRLRRRSQVRAQRVLAPANGSATMWCRPDASGFASFSPACHCRWHLKSIQSWKTKSGRL